MPVFVNLGRTEHSLRIGVTPSALIGVDDHEVKAELLRDLEPVLVRFVELELLALDTQKQAKISPEQGTDTIENINEDNWSQDGQVREKQGP